MGWNGSLSAASAVGASITYTPDTSATGAYTVTSFTAPVKGVYKFELKGSGGAKGTNTMGAWYAISSYNIAGGTGGSTTGYLLLDKGETVYIGAGGPCSAAYVAAQSGASLSAVPAAKLYFVAGGGGGGGCCCEDAGQRIAEAGANGGGTSGAGYSRHGNGWGGTQSAGGAGGEYSGADSGYAGAYGVGGASRYSSTNGGGGVGNAAAAISGRGGDGYYGGGSGAADGGQNSSTSTYISYGFAGAGGSGYVKTASVVNLGVTYTSQTSQGGGAGSGANGSVKVTYAARALLPVFFDGVQLAQLFFNGTEAASLVYNGQAVF